MYEKIISELLTIKGIDLKYNPNRDDFARFLRRPNPDKKQLSCIRKWAKEFDIPISLIVRAAKYNEMEEIWTD